MGNNERSRISISLEGNTLDRPNIMSRQIGFSVISFQFTGRARTGTWYLFNTLPDNRLVVTPPDKIITQRGKILVLDKEVNSALRMPDDMIVNFEPVMFETQRISPNDEKLVIYSLAYSNNNPKTLHESFLKEPTFYYPLGQDKSRGLSYRLKFWDTTPRGFIPKVKIITCKYISTKGF